jgi:HK97 gp10 family phage protein
MTETIRIDGLEKIGAVLARLPRAVSREIQREVLRKQAKLIADRARELAPKDSGDLRESIGVSDKLSKRQAGLHHPVDPEDVEMFAGAGPLPQAHLMEFGSQHNAAQPYMRPSWDAVRAAMPSGIAKDLWGYIVEALKK